MFKISKTELTRKLEYSIIKATRKQGVFGVLECTIGWFGKEIVDYITYDTKGIFRCYEIKCSLSDFHSKANKTFIGNYNYYVMPDELYEKVKCEIPNHIGVYTYGKLVKKPKRQDLITPKYLLNDNRQIQDILKDSMIRSLYREAEKLYDSGNNSVIQQKNREISRLNSEIKSMRKSDVEIKNLLFKKFGSRYIRVIEDMKDVK